jgi:SAM-dependent methyltransferase
MDITKIGTAWDNYKKSGIIETIHEQDLMYNTGKEWYWPVGESAMHIVASLLIAAPNKKVNRILDFGCGFGRCARHFRAFFPNAELYFCELNKTAAEFCSKTFSGEVVSLEKLPKDIDVIWLGSVFTHIDIIKTKLLFDILVASLANLGVFVATTNGRRAIQMNSKNPYISANRWADILAGYNATGAGYASYGRDDLGDYGVSLTDAARMIELGMNCPELRLLSYQEAAFANHQDAIAWTRYPIA